MLLIFVEFGKIKEKNLASKALILRKLNLWIQ
jgi:hypothetical protein